MDSDNVGAAARGLTRSITLVTVAHEQWLRFRRKEHLVHGSQRYHTMQSTCKASSVTWRSHREVSRKQGHVHRQRERFDEVSSRTATRVHHQGGDASRKRSCSLKTFVERHSAQTKASVGRINLPGTGTCVKLDDAKAANSLLLANVKT